MKSQYIKSKMMKANTHPGSILYTGKVAKTDSYIELISYNKESYINKRIDINDIDSLNTTNVNWLNVVGVNDISFIQEIGTKLGIDSLVLENITAIGSRAKYDDYNNYYFMLLNMLAPSDSVSLYRKEQLSIIIKDNLLITFQEIPADIFDPIRMRIEKKNGRIRSNGAEYLLYCLMDSVVDQYFITINDIEDRIETLENNIVSKSENYNPREIYSYRRSIMEIRTIIFPIKEIVKNLISEEDLFSKTEIKYLNDIYDNVSQILDSLSIYRELTMGLYEIYLSNISVRMNKIMTTLTIISVIFIPLTFLSSVYGMNFINIPELKLSWGYYGFWLISIILFVLMFTFFKKKKWFL